MARAIDADEFERFLMNLPDEVLCEDCCYVIVNEMRKQPTIEAEPVKHGKWIIAYDDYKFAMWDACSICGHGLEFVGAGKDYNFCPHCGARMDGE